MMATKSARAWRSLPALALVALLAACGVDGEPEQPTRGQELPSRVAQASPDS